MESVKGVEKFFLNLFHFSYKLDVIYNEKVVLTILFLKRICLVVLQRGYKVGGELLQSHIMPLFVRVLPFYGVSHSLDHVGLAESCASIYEEWVVLGSRVLYDDL